MPTALRPFDATKLTDDELTSCLFEMRRRGAAVAFYNPEEFITMTDGWEDQPSIEDVQQWFDRDYLEELMSEAVNKDFDLFLDSGGNYLGDHESDRGEEPGEDSPDLLYELEGK